MAGSEKTVSKKPAVKRKSTAAPAARRTAKPKVMSAATTPAESAEESPATLQAREAIAHFVEHNVAHLQAWLDKIAEEDGPRAAFDRLLHIMEYHMPKLARGDAEPGGGDKLTIIELHRY